MHSRGDNAYMHILKNNGDNCYLRTLVKNKKNNKNLPMFITNILKFWN